MSSSLFDASETFVLVDAVAWLTRTMLGSVGIGLCVIAVAIVGMMMLSGRLAVREGARVIIGCFVLLGAPSIAAGFQAFADHPDLRSADLGAPAPPPTLPRRNLPVSTYDPYAGASLRDDRRN